MKNDFGVSRWKPKILKIHSKYLIYNTNFLILFFFFLSSFIRVNTFIFFKNKIFRFKIYKDKKKCI